MSDNERPPPGSLQPYNYPPGLVVIPALEMMWTLSVSTIMKMVDPYELPPGSESRVIHGTTCIEQKRNEAVRSLLDRSDLQWLLFVDSDMTPPPDLAVRLLRHKVGVVSALCFGRCAPYPNIARRDGRYLEVDLDAEGGLEEVDLVGGGSVLIQRHVLEAMPEPWFDTRPGTSSDYVFCERVREAGFKVYVDTSVCVGHVTTLSVDKPFVQSYVCSPRSDGQMPRFRTTLQALFNPETESDAALWLERARAGGG